MKNIFYMLLTATPFKRDHTYWELLPANPQLAKYIRCFWGSTYPYVKQKNDDTKTVVIPDTCVDIIYHIDYTKNMITGKFCGINDTSFINCEDTPPGHLISVFAIRFYAWSAHAFSEDSLKGTMNEYCDAQSRFHWLDQILKPQLWETRSLEERSRLAEELFFRYPGQKRQNSVTDQAHLMREFRRYHAMDIQTAKKHAHDYVGNIQYNRDNFL